MRQLSGGASESDDNEAEHTSPAEETKSTTVNDGDEHCSQMGIEEMRGEDIFCGEFGVNDFVDARIVHLDQNSALFSRYSYPSEQQHPLLASYFRVGHGVRAARSFSGEADVGDGRVSPRVLDSPHASRERFHSRYLHVPNFSIAISFF